MEDIEDIGEQLTVRSSEIISASRRTDIPGMYMTKFVKCMRAGYIDVPNPMFHTKISRVSLDPKDVKCIVWWSKNFKPWIRAYQKDPELFDRYSVHLFNFSINSPCELEPGVKVSLDERLQQMKFLVDTFGVRKIKYRFDPIVFYREIDSDPKDPPLHNLEDFEYIIQMVSEMGIKDVIFSFCISYPKAVDRLKKQGLSLVKLSVKGKKGILNKLLKITQKYGVIMRSCCDNDLLGYVGKDGGKIESSSCVDGILIQTLLEEKDGKLRRKSKDRGQRKECRCVLSRDVGRYDWICGHECVYCYAGV